MTRLALAPSLACVLACGAPSTEAPASPVDPASTKPAAPPAVDPIADPQPSADDAAATPVETSPVEMGPAVGDAVTREAREAAVLDLLAGAAPAARLVVVDVDPGKAFAPNLRDAIAPRESVSGIPRVRHETPTVSAGLDRDIVRRIVRASSNQLQHCYNVGLVRDASLRGKVEVSFAIGTDGRVATAAVTRTTLRGTSGKLLGECLAKATRRWKFPEPTGGVRVDVVFPFDLRTE